MKAFILSDQPHAAESGIDPLELLLLAQPIVCQESGPTAGLLLYSQLLRNGIFAFLETLEYRNRYER
jgi:hypothetical protein